MRVLLPQLSSIKSIIQSCISLKLSVGQFLWLSTVLGLLFMAAAYYWYMTILGESCFARAQNQVNEIRSAAEDAPDLEAGKQFGVGDFELLDGVLV